DAIRHPVPVPIPAETTGDFRTLVGLPCIVAAQLTGGDRHAFQRPVWEPTVAKLDPQTEQPLLAVRQRLTRGGGIEPEPVVLQPERVGFPVLRRQRMTTLSPATKQRPTK